MQAQLETHTRKHTQIYKCIHTHNKSIYCQVPQTDSGIHIPLSTWQDTEEEEIKIKNITTAILKTEKA